MDLEKRISLIKAEPTEEVITDESLRQLLETKSHPTAYDGFEPSGQIHIASGLMRAIKIQQLLDAGVKFKLLLADWHAWTNNKMGGDLDLIQKVGKYFIESWKACGLDSKNIEFVWASDLVQEKDYWKTVLNVGRLTTLKRIIRAGQSIGRAESEMQYTSQLFYPAMQCADPFYLEADICQLGMDQRKVTILSRELGPKLGFWKPVCVHHHLVMGLTGPERMGSDAIEREIEGKMSKSKGAAIFIQDSPEEIKSKINSAYCKEKDTQTNPVLELWRYIILQKLPSYTIERPQKFGGNLEVHSYQELESIYRSGGLHPLDLKNATSDAIIQLLEPVRTYFKKPGPKKLYEEIKAAKVTR